MHKNVLGIGCCVNFHGIKVYLYLLGYKSSKWHSIILCKRAAHRSWYRMGNWIEEKPIWFKVMEISYCFFIDRIKDIMEKCSDLLAKQNHQVNVNYVQLECDCFVN